MNTIKTLSIGLLLTLIFASVTSAQEMTPADLIGKHLDAFASKDTRGKLKNIMAIGNSEFESRNPSAMGGGRAVVVSNPTNLMFVMSFNSKDYPFEKIGYFGGKTNIPFAIAGKRSLLGSFLMEHGSVLDDGLFGGVYSMRWPMAAMDKSKAKVKFAGTKKIDGVEALVLEYLPAKSGTSEFFIRLFFDAEKFNHIRTEYRREIPAGRIIFGQQNQIAGSTLNLTEEFADFKKVEGYNLPHSYRVHFVSNSGASTVENIWGMKVAQFRFDQPLEADFFSFEPVSK